MIKNTTNQSFFITAMPLFLVLFIDGMGLGLVFPLLNALIMDSHSSLLPSHFGDAIRNICFGSIVSIYMICWFFGASFLGDLSDQIGRRKALLLCLIGAFLGYVLSAISVLMHSLSLLLVGRVIAGFTAGSQPIAQAAIVDLSEPEHKVRNLGFILLSVCVGFIVGPLMGGILSNQHFSTHFNYVTPFYFASFISLINIVLLLTLMKETFIRDESAPLNVKIHRAIEVFLEGFRDEKIRGLSAIFFVMIFGWSCYYSYVAMFMVREFQVSVFGTSLFMTLMGVGFVIATGFLADRCSKWFKLRPFSAWMAFLAGAFAFITGVVSHAVLAWLLAIPVALTIALAYSMMLAIFSDQAGEDAQGWVMGITGAIMALSFGLSAFITSLAANISPRLPIIMAGIFMSAAGIWLSVYRLQSEKQN